MWSQFMALRKSDFLYLSDLNIWIANKFWWKSALCICNKMSKKCSGDDNEKRLTPVDKLGIVMY
jgi:hypothetical protein